ncbi:hypothetical protein ACX1N1_05675 [Acinetobacter sp. ANC 3791]
MACIHKTCQPAILLTCFIASKSYALTQFACWVFKFGVVGLYCCQPIKQQILVQGIQRQYLVLDAHRQKPAPLVIVLHGGGGNASRMLQRWQAVTQREGLIVVAPNAEKATWNALGCCGDAQQQQSADVAFIQAMLKEVEQ